MKEFKNENTYFYEYHTLGRVRMWGSWVLPIVSHLFGLAVHGQLIHLEPCTRSQVIGPPSVRMGHVLIGLFRPWGHTFRCRVVCAHKWPDVTTLAAGHVPFSGHVLVPISVLGAELCFALHLWQ